jgi:hypothetical protein
MTLEKSERYRKISVKAGLMCSYLYIVEIIIIFALETFLHFGPTWIVIIGGLSGFGALISALVCVLTAIIGRRTSN